MRGECEGAAPASHAQSVAEKPHAFASAARCEHVRFFSSPQYYLGSFFPLFSTLASQSSLSSSSEGFPGSSLDESHLIPIHISCHRIGPIVILTVQLVPGNPGSSLTSTSLKNIDVHPSDEIAANRISPGRCLGVGPYTARIYWSTTTPTVGERSEKEEDFSIPPTIPVEKEC